MHIEITDKIVISDPCRKFIKNNDEQVIVNMLSGNYNCHIEKITENDTVFINAVTIMHDTLLREMQNHLIFQEIGHIDIDSGIAGVFDYDYFAENCKNQEWYEKICEKAIIREKNPDYLTDSEFFKKIYNKSIVYGTLEEMVNSLQQYETSIHYFRENLINNADILDNKAFISSSGIGDGYYACEVATNKDGKTVAVRIKFITESE